MEACDWQTAGCGKEPDGVALDDFDTDIATIYSWICYFSKISNEASKYSNNAVRKYISRRQA
jgi:hypothetical protein